MTKASQNKSSLNREIHKRQTYSRFLPSLELKQQQLLSERRIALTAQQELEHQIEVVRQWVQQQLPMLAAANIELSGLVRVETYAIEMENLVGVILPKLGEVKLERAAYGYLARPHWVEKLAEQWEIMLLLHLQHKVMNRRIELLQVAVRKVTQRINLFSKVLIPNAEHNIKRIGLFLSDQERAAVVRSKIAKQRHGEG